jgi:hypothetical protein
VAGSKGTGEQAPDCPLGEASAFGLSCVDIHEAEEVGPADLDETTENALKDPSTPDLLYRFVIG